MISDIRARGGWVSVWGPVLNIPQVVGGLIFMGTLAGALILVINLFTLVVAGRIHKRRPFSRLTSLCHLPWLVLVPYLITVWHWLEGWSAFAIWLLYVLVTMVLCLILDVVSLAKYAAGDRSEFQR